jgi:hypothetical protein
MQMIPFSESGKFPTIAGAMYGTIKKKRDREREIEDSQGFIFIIFFTDSLFAQ